MDIRTLTDGAFSGLVNLKHLTLKKLNFTYLDEGLFHGLEKLRYLMIDHSPLQNLPKLSNLKRLNRLNVLGANIHRLRYDSFTDMSLLRTVYFDDSQLVHFFADTIKSIANISAGKEQSNSTAQSVCDPLAVINGTALKWRVLHLRKNKLNLFSKNFMFFSHLENIDLSYNELRILPEDIFSGLSELKDLSLNNNEITYLPPGVFLCVPKLKNLWLSNNRVRTIEVGTLLPLINLFRLMLEHNKIVSPIKEMFTVPQRLLLRNNHIACACDELWIRQLNHSWMVPKYEFVECTNATHVALLDFLDKTCCAITPGVCQGVTDQATFTHIDTNTLAIASAGASLMIMILIITLVVCKRRMGKRTNSAAKSRKISAPNNVT